MIIDGCIVANPVRKREHAAGSSSDCRELSHVDGNVSLSASKPRYVPRYQHSPLTKASDRRSGDRSVADEGTVSRDLL